MTKQAISVILIALLIYLIHVMRTRVSSTEGGKNYPQADTMFALMELYEANLYDIIRNHEEDDKSSSVFIHHSSLAWEYCF